MCSLVQLAMQTAAQVALHAVDADTDVCMSEYQFAASLVESQQCADLV